jgi:hypothetical protein
VSRQRTKAGPSQKCGWCGPLTGLDASDHGLCVVCWSALVEAAGAEGVDADTAHALVTRLAMYDLHVVFTPAK